MRTTSRITSTLILVLGATLGAGSCGSPARRSTTPKPAPTVTAIATLRARADSGHEPARPPLPSGADSNSAAAYYDTGAQLVRYSMKLDTADMYLYWASRLDPEWAEPIFLRALIVLRAFRKDALDALRRSRSLSEFSEMGLSPEQIHQVDSLLQAAWGRNPFLYSDLDTPPYWEDVRDPSGAAVVAYANAKFATAESLFTKALRKHPKSLQLRLYRARARFYLQRWDDAVRDIATVRDTLRHTAETEVSPILPSVAMLEFAIGITRVQQDDFPASRAAFERALTEDIGFYWAHTRMAGSALALHDTAAAMAELDAAMQMEGGDPVLRLYDGALEYAAGHHAAAETQLARAIAIDPYYATPYYWLGLVCQAENKPAEAKRLYREFLSRAALQDPVRATAINALKQLGGAGADSL